MSLLNYNNICQLTKQKLLIQIGKSLFIFCLFLILGCSKGKHSTTIDKDFHLDSYPFGGDFILTDQDGKKFDLKNHRGKVFLLFFGYTFCSDVCPLKLSKLKKVKEILGSKADKVQTILVSVDPERDTPTRLKEYLKNHDPNAIGLTGTKKQIDLLVKQYATLYRKNTTQSPTRYTVDHSTRTFMIDQKGKLRYLFSRDDKPKMIVSVVELLLP